MKVDYSNIGFVRRNFTPVKNKLLNKNSQTESKFEKMLIDANIYFTREKCNYRIGSRWCYYDFFVPYWRLYFELDGGSHNNEEQKEIDTEKDCIVRNKQRFICRISNNYVLNEMTEINFEIAKDLLFKYMVKSRFLRKKAKTYEKAKDYYERNLEKNHLQSVEDFTANNPTVDFDDDRPITLYNNYTGLYYTFDDIIDAALKTGMPPKFIWELCYTEYKRIGNNRKYVAAFSVAECERRVAIVYE